MEPADVANHRTRSRVCAALFALLVAGAVAHGFVRSNQYAWAVFALDSRPYFDVAPPWAYEKSFGYPLKEPAWMRNYSSAVPWRADIVGKDKVSGRAVTLAFNWLYGACTVASAFFCAYRLAGRVFADGMAFRMVHLVVAMVGCALAFWSTPRFAWYEFLASILLPDAVGILSLSWCVAWIGIALQTMVLARLRRVRRTTH